MNLKNVLIITLIILIFAALALMIIFLSPKNNLEKEDIQSQPPQIQEEKSLEEPMPQQENFENLEDEIQKIDELEKSLENEIQKMEEEIKNEGL